VAYVKSSENLTKLAIDGYASWEGGDTYNKKLSQRRADAVKAEFVKLDKANEKSGVFLNLQQKARAIGQGRTDKFNAKGHEGDKRSTAQRKLNRRVNVTVNPAK
jgi:outer membrane protein OmpA-like peptidoglycan-associated protein